MQNIFKKLTQILAFSMVLLFVCSCASKKPPYKRHKSVPCPCEKEGR